MSRGLVAGRQGGLRSPGSPVAEAACAGRGKTSAARREQCALAAPPPGFPKPRQAQRSYRQRRGVSDDVAMVTLGSLLSNEPELQEVAKVFSHVLKQMAVYLNFEYKYTVGGKEKTYTRKPPAGAHGG